MSKKRKTKKVSKIAKQTKIDQTQDQLDDARLLIRSVLDALGSDEMIAHLLLQTKTEMEFLNPSWYSQMDESNPKLRKALRKEVAYLKTSTREYKVLLDLLERSAKQRARIAKLHRP